MQGRDWVQAAVSPGHDIGSIRDQTHGIAAESNRESFPRTPEIARAHPLIVAHRGDSFHAPENTLEAARLAWKSGAPAWELDVQLTRDGVPVVLHDESLVRTTDVATRFAGDPRGRDGFRITDFDFEEVRSLDAGSWFVDGHGGPRSARAFNTLNQLDAAHIEHYRSGQVLIPTLAEALSLTREQDWLVNVEIKSFPEQPPGLVERVLDVIAETDTAERVLISSFDHSDIVAARHPDRRYVAGDSHATPLYRIDAYATDLVGADTVHVSTEVLGADRSPIVERARREPCGATSSTI